MAPLSAAPALTQHPSPRSSNISFAIIEISRKWWNWQTHHLEGVAPKGVGVQIPPSAPPHSFRSKAAQGPRNQLAIENCRLKIRHDYYTNYDRSYHRFLLPHHRGAAAERQER